ncbi:antibiotic biosynthesis monooxygenase [Rhodococcus hoagii]|nr:antibiotic biosynthesis monooxygenase [Prescottella equi]NKR73748.1 antibiotic biosynthesis monooxygenase [Prescottella equi]NKS14799.1 antibiotic biosynthesis monooxygenase [Prescottella equi]
MAAGRSGPFTRGRVEMQTAFIRVTVRPDHADRDARAMLDLVEPTLGEPGCIAYEFCHDLDDPGFLHCFEHWKTCQALDDHASTAHMRALLDEFGSADRTLGFAPHLSLS